VLWRRSATASPSPDPRSCPERLFDQKAGLGVIGAPLVASSGGETADRGACSWRARPGHGGSNHPVSEQERAGNPARAGCGNMTERDE